MRITPTGDETFDEALRKLTAGIRSLDGTDGRARARGTARKHVLQALRRIRRVLDEQAPAIIERRVGERLKTFEGREARLLKRGYVHASERDCAIFAAAGVPIRRLVHKTVHDGKTLSTTSALFVPAWAIAIGSANVTKLRQAKKSIVLQKAILAEKALRENSVMA